MQRPRSIHQQGLIEESICQQKGTQQNRYENLLSLQRRNLHRVLHHLLLLVQSIHVEVLRVSLSMFPNDCLLLCSSVFAPSQPLSRQSSVTYSSWLPCLSVTCCC